MKKIILMVLILMFLVSCTNQTETKKEINKIGDFTSFVIQTNNEKVQIDEMPVIKTFTIRAVDKGFSPDTITVNHGDTVGLYITNTRTKNVETISISECPVEDFYHSGNMIYIQFVATTKGEFDLGDDRANTQKGKIIVR